MPFAMYTSLLVLCPTLLALAGPHSTCYYPNFTTATGQVPCNATASNTSTDASASGSAYGNEYCLANGLCWFDGTISRGSCTDIHWVSPSCAQWCQEEQRNTSMNIFPCHQQHIWQCEWHNDCPSNFTLQTSEIAVIIRDDQQPNAVHAIQFADSNAKFVAAVSETINSVPLPATTRNIDTSVPAAANIASSTSANRDSTSTPIPTGSSGLTTAGKASIAVGVVGGSLAVGTLLFHLFVWWRRSAHRNDKGPANSPGDTGHYEHRKPELTGQPSRTEMDAVNGNPELVAQDSRWEMG